MGSCDESALRSKRPELWFIGAGAVALAVSWVLALPDTVSTAEREVFRFVNEWPDWLEGPIWPVMQLGVIAAVPVATILLFLMLATGLFYDMAEVAFVADEDTVRELRVD